MIILGIDPGSVITGFAILEKQKCEPNLKVVDFGCIITEGFSTTGEKLKTIHKEIKKLILQHKPDAMAIENLFFFKNMKTVIPVSQTKGVILLAAEENNLPVFEFTPLQVKMTVAGYGRADKKQVQGMIKKTIDISSFDLSKNHRKKDDAFDAIGVALCATLKAY